jgi:hypothetical protein
MTDRCSKIVVNSWCHLQDELFSGAWDSKLGRFRSNCAFRGLSDASYRLDTTLRRLGGEFPCLEKHLLRNFQEIDPWLTTAELDRCKQEGCFDL